MSIIVTLHNEVKIITGMYKDSILASNINLNTSDSSDDIQDTIEHRGMYA